jgi:Fur family peroxide stress response transcriptional regulator
MERIEELFRQKGLRVTPQREAIFRLLRSSKEHPTAEQIYRDVRQVFPVISFTTVYKTMQTLEASGLLQRFNTGANIYRYDADVQPHPHFICLGCGKVEDMEHFPADFGHYVERAAATSPNRLQFVNVFFYGYCPHCEDGNRTNIKGE